MDHALKYLHYQHNKEENVLSSTDGGDCDNQGVVGERSGGGHKGAK